MKKTRIFFGSLTALLFLDGVSPAAFFQIPATASVGSSRQERSKLIQVNSQGPEIMMSLSRYDVSVQDKDKDKDSPKPKPKPSPSK